MYAYAVDDLTREQREQFDRELNATGEKVPRQKPRQQAEAQARLMGSAAARRGV